MSLSVQVTIKDETTPLLAELTRKLADVGGLNRRIADRAEILTRRHITAAARTRRSISLLSVLASFRPKAMLS
jgi:hypothetical protein